MAEKHHAGSCQCGAVDYEVDVDIDNAVVCNCSRCERMGFTLAFAPRGNFTLKSGEDKLTEYRFNSKSIQHLFCSICGVESFAYGKMPDGSEIAAINVNCLEGVDPRALDVKKIDGKSM